MDKAYLVEGEIEEVEEAVMRDPLEGLKVMAFDIEAYNPQRSPDPKKDPS